jgi:hypothetical protein
MVLFVDAGCSCSARVLWQCHDYRINSGDYQYTRWQYAYDGSIYADNSYFWLYDEGHHHDR